MLHLNLHDVPQGASFFFAFSHAKASNFALSPRRFDTIEFHLGLRQAIEVCRLVCE